MLIGYGHIFCFFIEVRGLYLRRQLMQLKAVDVYNYFQTENVKSVRM